MPTVQTTPSGEAGVLAPPARSPFETPAPGLVTSPPLDRRLPAWPADSRRNRPRGTAPAADWWLLGAHGGAGVTSLRRAGVGGADAERRWPGRGPVVVVTRRSGVGLEWARDTARQHASGDTPEDVVLAGLVVVADAPGRTPARLARFLQLVTAAYPRVWEVPWVEEWRLAGHAEPLPAPPAVRQLGEDMQALIDARTDQEKE